MLYSTTTYAEPVKLLYGSSVVLWGGLRCYIAPLHIQNLLSSCMILQWFFGGGIKVLYSTTTYAEPVKLLYGSSVVLWGGLRCYIAPLHIQNLLSSCMILQWFFVKIKVLYSSTAYAEPVKLLYGSSVVLWGGLRCYIAPLHIQNLLSSCMDLQWFFGVTEGLYSTDTIYRTC